MTVHFSMNNKCQGVLSSHKSPLQCGFRVSATICDLAFCLWNEKTPYFANNGFFIMLLLDGILHIINVVNRRGISSFFVVENTRGCERPKPRLKGTMPKVIQF